MLGPISYLAEMLPRQLARCRAAFAILHFFWSSQQLYMTTTQFDYIDQNTVHIISKILIIDYYR